MKTTTKQQSSSSNNNNKQTKQQLNFRCLVLLRGFYVMICLWALFGVYSSPDVTHAILCALYRVFIQRETRSTDQSEHLFSEWKSDPKTHKKLKRTLCLFFFLYQSCFVWLKAFFWTFCVFLNQNFTPKIFVSNWSIDFWNKNKHLYENVIQST